ncbi:MAG: hypothetical protein JXO22_17790 [Phycisphaerae bacterium]|nr:hypothetical protein [Phycisphaerae bacterium]
MFISLFYPDSRDFLGQALRRNPSQKADDWRFTITCIVGVVFAGVVCRCIAATSFASEESRRVASNRCSECGYLLYGLPEPRCPECGAAFDPRLVDLLANPHGPEDPFEAFDQDGEETGSE